MIGEFSVEKAHRSRQKKQPHMAICILLTLYTSDLFFKRVPPFHMAASLYHIGAAEAVAPNVCSLRPVCSCNTPSRIAPIVSVILTFVIGANPTAAPVWRPNPPEHSTS